MTIRTRREFLSVAGTGIAGGLFLTSGAAAQPPVRIRRNVMSAAAKKDLTSLSKGVAEMRKLAASNPGDPRGWILQAFLHGNCGGFTKCKHGNWFFAPWHRSLLYYFEQLIQHFSADPTFALPYWDWSRTHSVPGSFYGPTNPLNDTLSIASSCGGAPTAGRGRTAAQSFSTSDLNIYVGTSVINTMQNNPDFTTYAGGNPGAGELESRPHNFIHRWVGGTKFSNMVQYFSPLDPIFWLHHCNIDRLYSNWLAKPAHHPPSDPVWIKTSFNDFFDATGKPAGGAFTCGQTVDSTVMGYVYDRVVDLPPRLTTGLQEPAPAQVTVGSLTGAQPNVQGNVLTFNTSAAGDELRLAVNATAMGAAEYITRLRIVGVKVPPRQNTSVDVFLGGNITANTPLSSPSYAGSFTFFDGREGGDGHQHDGSRDILINVSEALQRLYGDIGVPQGTNLPVSLVTRPLYAGVTAFSTVQEIQPEQVRLDVVRFGG